MTKQEFLAQFEELLEVDAGSIKADDELSNLDCWDSLAVMTFIAMVDEQFDITLSPANIEKAITVKDLMALLGGKVTG